MEKKPVWIAGIARGHNAGVCPLKDGEIVFAIEEERLTRQSMTEVLCFHDENFRIHRQTRFPSSCTHTKFTKNSR